jgi:hypothetical protein
MIGIVQMQRYSLWRPSQRRCNAAATAVIADVGWHSPVILCSTGGCNVLQPTEAYAQEYAPPKQLLVVTPLIIHFDTLQNTKIPALLFLVL